MAKTKVLITVKTYPAISEKYDELVCTAGFLEDGSWIRIYPIQFRKKSFGEQYKKYDWIEIDLVKNASDFRKESYRPVSYDTEIKILDHLDTKSNWLLRKEIVFKNKIYTDLDELIKEAKNKEIMTSLAVFFPTEIVDFTIESVEREWDKNKLAKLKQDRSSNLFAQEDEDLFEVVKKLPYKFSYIIKDSNGKQSKMMIEDWEIGQLYWNCLKKHEGNENKAVQDVKKQYLDNFAKTKDLHLFLGTSQLFHFTGKNPFMIIGTFHPLKEQQLSFQFFD
ncbi:hypothetical protein [Chryseobacterium oryctis]|uniref:Uncharacterized protein n=1 Tax=Chryseobacterium oryctis TaxID=2952618 RepID=A0ABT3HQR5_9FLAO|nr:hypothetical protein [Chryseobacterium oryctis]MCW3162127.1 hypothetical protein [Chryseobacterium oryctis]